MKNTTPHCNHIIRSAEENYKTYLTSLSVLSVTAEDIRTSAELANNFAEHTHTFIDKVVLCSKINCRSLQILNQIGYERDMAISDLTMHLMLNKLDYLLLHNPSSMIPLIMQICRYKLIDIVRMELKVQYESLEEEKYASIASDDDIEHDFMEKLSLAEHRTKALKMLSFSSDCSRFELLSFLATRGMTDSSEKFTKPEQLAFLINKDGLLSVSNLYFLAAAREFNLPYESFFKEFKNNKLPEYHNLSTLARQISHAAENCTKKLQRKAKKINLTYTH